MVSPQGLSGHRLSGGSWVQTTEESTEVSVEGGRKSELRMQGCGHRAEKAKSLGSAHGRLVSMCFRKR